MTKVFIGGSRRVSRLSAEVRARLDKIIEKSMPVVIGDANGADKAVQRYLHSQGYSNVEVFCANGVCRNNLGDWCIRTVRVPRTARGFEYYVAKDQQMAKEGAVGLMLWDGVSRGTLANIVCLVEQSKKVVVYLAPTKKFFTLRSRTDLEQFLASKNGVHESRRGFHSRRSVRPNEASLF